MGDGRTEIRKDSIISEKHEKIKGLEGTFDEEPTDKLAQDIISELELYSMIRRGYNSQPDKEWAQERINFYQDYIEGKNDMENKDVSYFTKIKSQFSNFFSSLYRQ